MTETPETLQAPSDVLVVDGVKYKMTYGVLTDLQRVIPDPEQIVSYVLTDSFVRDYIVRRVLTPAKGLLASEADLLPAEEVELSPSEVQEVLDWAVAHLLHFFVKSAQGLQKQGSRLRTLVAPSPPSTVGSEA